jgi:hypothetical protein
LTWKISKLIFSQHIRNRGVTMNTKTVLGALCGVASALSLWGASASAATITYTITGTGTGTTELGTQFGTFVTPFTNVSFEIQVLGDSDFSGTDPTGHYIYAPTVTLNGFGGAFPLDVAVADTPLLADGSLPSPVPGVGFGVFGYQNEPSSPGVFVSTAGFTGVGLDTYNLLNDFGPIPITFCLLPSLEVTNGPEIDFTSITNATFSASGIPTGIPEPATWAVMLVGFGGLGTVMRARRKRVAAAI